MNGKSNLWELAKSNLAPSIRSYSLRGAFWCLATLRCWAAILAALGIQSISVADDREAPGLYQGQFYAGRGDVEYLRLLDNSRRMFSPDAEFENMSMLYMPAWNGLVEGPTWDAWWIQNSYGTTYAALPFFEEPFLTFLQNSQDLWFDQMGDGHRVGAAPPFNWVAPDGCLCDAARPGWIVYKQGDGRTAIHDWAMEFTAAGILLQSELLLINRDLPTIERYLPKLERSAQFIESRRDPAKNLFLAGPAANLLAPSFAGWPRPDGTFGQAYLAGLSITYIAALDRLIEVEKLAGKAPAAALWSDRRDAAKKGLSLLMTDEQYFIRSLDPDGTRHGVFGALHHGYFEASPNHDAICFRVVDDQQAELIYAKIEAIPELRPYHFILPNYPSYDDMYEKPLGLWDFGTWVNGGHWSTCEARAILAYYRLGKFQDIRDSLNQLLTFARIFRMDNPLVKFGSAVYQPGEPINLTYDAFGPPAAFVRGLFEYLYRADDLTLVPQIPPQITELHHRFPVRFGRKRIYMSTLGTGAVTRVLINGEESKQLDAKRIVLPYKAIPDRADVLVLLGGAAPHVSTDLQTGPFADSQTEVPLEKITEELRGRYERASHYLESLTQAGLKDSYEASHARLALAAIRMVGERRSLVSAGKLPTLPERSQTAADKLYVQTAIRLCDGLENLLKKSRPTSEARDRETMK